MKTPSERTTRTSTAAPPIFLHTDITNNHSICALPIYDFHHPTIMEFVSKTPTNPIAKCKETITPFTKLEDSSWSIISPEKNCSARCIYENGFKTVKKGGWMAPGHVDCEFLEAVCWEEQKEVYGYIHTQILRKNITSEPTEKEKKKNVFVILIDSLSFGMAKRSLPQTRSFLSKRLNSVEFPFVNKVGENSQPNIFPLWFGKQVEAGKTIDGKDIHVDWSDQEYCERHLDNETHIFKQFNESGYVTFHAEDWANQAVDSYPFCKGFRQSPVHHSMRPFQSIHEHHGAYATKRHLDGEFCRTIDAPVFEYFQQFLDTYKDEPKFAWLWLNVPSHDDFNGVGWYDQMYTDFLIKNERIFNESYVFFMGDHGYRGGGGQSHTEIGQMERNNPFLSISVPQNIPENKKSEMMKRMRENVEHLQTHYDTRATLLDIIGAPSDKGESYFREQTVPRTCSSLPIPYQYCICQVKKVKVTDPPTISLLANALISHVNHRLSDLHDICEIYESQEVTSLIHFGDFEQNATEHTFKIALKVAPPSTAHFETLVIVKEHQNAQKEFEFGKVIRLDTYGKTVDCTKERRFDKLCFCKTNSTVADSYFWFF